MPRTRFSLALIAAALFLPALAACNDSSGSKEKGAASAAPARPPSAVATVTVTPEKIAIVNELPGRISPTRIAEVRPRVSGIVTDRVFTQGSRVEAGEVLYKIDPAKFKVEVARTQASLERAKAEQLRAQQDADRQKQLLDRKVIAAQQLETSNATLAQANAAVAVAKAELDAALVSANNAEPLATILQLDPVYADFTQSVRELMALRKSLNMGALAEDPGEAPVKLVLDDGTEYGRSGRLLFSDTTVDRTTGQVILRAEFPNPDGDLLPGLYVRVLIEQGVDQEALAVPQQAVQHDAGGNAQVYVVNADSKAELRPVTTGRVVGQRWIITEGLQAGDKVIVEGFQKIRPGAPVNPQPWQSEGTAVTEPSDGSQKAG